jgi:hypothetical protein
VADTREPWHINFECDTGRVPADVLALVRSHLEEMGRALVLIEAGSPFWSSLRESGMRIDVGGWRFTFRVDADGVALEEVKPSLL